MRIKEWIGENIGYRFFGCLYNKSHDHIFTFIQSKIPKEVKRGPTEHVNSQLSNNKSRGSPRG